MKKIFLTAFQFVLFLLTFAVGSFVHPFNLRTNLDRSNHLGVTHIFIWDGLLLLIGLYLVIIVIEALSKRLLAAAPWTTLAFILATVFGLVMKFGFLTLEF